MAKSAHSTIPPTESDFNGSHPTEESTPSLGDLSAVESEINTPADSSMRLGDLSQINDEEHNDALGDITLLEEAFAELEDSANSMLSSETELESMEIPTLSDSIEPPTSLSVSQLESMEEELSKSIPILDQQATIYEEMPQSSSDENSGSEQPETTSEVNDIASTLTDNEPDKSTVASNFITIETVQSDVVTPEPLLGAEAENFSEAFEALSDDEIASSLSQVDVSNEPSKVEESQAAESDDDTIDSIIDSAIQQQTTFTSEQDEQKSEISRTEPLLTDEDLSLAYEQSLSRFAEDLESEELMLEQLDIDSENSTPDLIESTFTDFNIKSVDAKVAQATEESNKPDLNDGPRGADAIDFHQSELIDSDSVSTFAEDLAITEIPDMISEADDLPSQKVSFDSDPIVPETKELQSELLPAEPAPEQAPTHAEHSVAIGESANFSLNIPFELHSQLSQKIDSLVIEATTSLTHELHIQLADRMETLLSNSVESVLPRLIEQMTSELRREVKSQVKTQLPIIINDVLGKTRLSK